MTPYDAPSTRQSILSVAFEEIHRRGFHETSLADILARTEVTKGALYHHFSSKDELGLAVIDEVIGAWIRANKIAPFEVSDDPIAVIREFVEEMAGPQSELTVKMGCPLGNLSQELSTCHEVFRQHIESLYGQWREAIAGCVSRGLEAGKVREGTDPASVATFVIAMSQGIAQLMKNQGSLEPFRSVRPLLLDFLQTLRPES